MVKMYRPKTSHNPAHLVRFPEAPGRTYLESMALTVDELAGMESDPDQAARKVGQRLAEEGAISYPPANLKELLMAIETDDSLHSSLVMVGAEPPLVEASKMEVRQARNLDLEGWAETLVRAETL